MLARLSILGNICNMLISNNSCFSVNVYKNDTLFMCNRNNSTDNCQQFEYLCTSQYYAISNTHSLSTLKFAHSNETLSFVNKFGFVSHAGNFSLCYSPEIIIQSNDNQLFNLTFIKPSVQHNVIAISFIFIFGTMIIIFM